MTTDTTLAIHLEVLLMAARCQELAAVVEQQDPVSTYNLRRASGLLQKVGKSTRLRIEGGERQRA